MPGNRRSNSGYGAWFAFVEWTSFSACALLQVPPFTGEENSLNLRSAIFDGTVQTYADSLQAMVYKQIPSYSDTIMVKMGSDVTVYLTKDQSLLEIPKKEGGQEL